MDAKNLADLYNLPLMGWAPIQARLEQGLTQAPDTGGPNRHTFWLTTINPDGSPHVTAVGGWWTQGAFWFCTGATSRKGRNLDRDSRCVISVAADTFDVSISGEALQIRDRDKLADFAKTANKDGWPASIDDSGEALTAEYSAPSAGPPPWHVYRLEPSAASALSTVEPGGATRWNW